MRVFLCTILILSASLSFAQSPSGRCGSWRWNVKTITDRDGPGLLTSKPVKTTIDQLVSVKPDRILNGKSTADGRTPRLATEKQVVEVIAYVTKVKMEKDHDFHLVLKSTTSENTMVGEIPDPGCPNYDNFPALRTHFEKTRREGQAVWNLWMRTHRPVKVRVTGVPFWDGFHDKRPKGASPYYREIHPILSIVPVD